MATADESSKSYGRAGLKKNLSDQRVHLKLCSKYLEHRSTNPSDQKSVWDGICSTVLVPLPPIMTIPRDGVAVMVDLKQIF